MTTAHRPTFNAAMGGEDQGGSRWHVPSRQVSAKNMPGYLTLKQRHFPTEGVETASREALREQLLAREAEHASKKNKEKLAAGATEDEDDNARIAALKPTTGNKYLAGLDLRVEDPDERIESDSSDSESESDSDAGSDDDDDDDEELMRQLEQIRRERKEEQERKEREARERAEREKDEAAMLGNPLLFQTDKSFTVKRRWDDDVVFKNQARDEPEFKKRFINDTVRNDFHRRFLEKYVK